MPIAAKAKAAKVLPFGPMLVKGNSSHKLTSTAATRKGANTNQFPPLDKAPAFSFLISNIRFTGFFDPTRKRQEVIDFTLIFKSTIEPPFPTPICNNYGHFINGLLVPTIKKSPCQSREGFDDAPSLLALRLPKWGG